MHHKSAEVVRLFPSKLTVNQHREDKRREGSKVEKMKFPLSKQCFLIKTESAGRLSCHGEGDLWGPLRLKVKNVPVKRSKQEVINRRRGGEIFFPLTENDDKFRLEQLFCMK